MFLIGISKIERLDEQGLISRGVLGVGGDRDRCYFVRKEYWQHIGNISSKIYNPIYNQVTVGAESLVEGRLIEV